MTRLSHQFTPALLAAAIAFAPASLAANPAAEPQEAATFIVVYDPGPVWEIGKPPSEQPGVRNHGRYLIQLYSEGVMTAAGPFEDGGGAVIFRAADEAEARAIVAADPGVASGLLVVVTLRQWHPRDWDKFLPRPEAE